MSMEEKVVTAQVQSNSSCFFCLAVWARKKKQAKNPKLLLKGPSEPWEFLALLGGVRNSPTFEPLTLKCGHFRGHDVKPISNTFTAVKQKKQVPHDP